MTKGERKKEFNMNTKEPQKSNTCIETILSTER